MQDATVQTELHPPHSGGNLPPITRESTGPPGNNEPIGHDEPTGARKDAPQVAGAQPPFPLNGPRAKPRTFLPQRGVYYAAIAGVIAGVVTALLTFLVGLIPSYPGTLAVNGTTMTAGSLVISLLLLCLWSMGGGLVSLFGTWVVTVRHPHYLRLGEEQ
jgi:hypothetical protein